LVGLGGVPLAALLSLKTAESQASHPFIMRKLDPTRAFVSNFIAEIIAF
jgi:hypothetical protein